MSPDGCDVLVTGADGFIGSHLVQRLQADGHRVRALCAYNSMGSLGWLDTIENLNDIEPVLGDVCDPRFVSDAVRGVEVVHHLAALISIPFSYQAPRVVFETNVFGTMHVLDAALEHGIRRVVHTSTSEVYGTPESVPITESHPLQGQSPYSASKIAADKLAESYALSFDAPVVTLRPFNTFGPRQSLRAVIPVVLRQMLSGVGEIHMGSLDPRRDFTYVSDTVDGFARMGADAALEPGSVVHLGTGVAVSIGELIEICREVTGSSAEIVTDPDRVRPAGSEVMVLQSDPQKSGGRMLSWKPEKSLREGLTLYAEWLQAADLRDDPSVYLR